MIHPKALVDDDNAIGGGTRVWAFAHVMAGARVGRQCNIGDHAFVESGAVLGNNVTIKNNVLIWEGITIEDDAFVGPGVVFSNDRYPRSPRAPGAKARYADKTTWLETTVVRQGCSIGAAATICPGVELGRFSMVGAGALVSRSVEPYGLVVGSPAVKVDCVCSCGQRLGGHYLENDCLACGETAAARGAPPKAITA